MNKNINNLTINEISFFNKIFGENKATDIIQNQESELFLFYNGLSETFNHKDRDNHFILLSISKLIDNDNYNKLNEVFDEEYNYSIKNVSFLMNKKSLCSTDGIPTLKLDDSCIIRDNLIIVEKRTIDNEDSKTKEFLNNIQWAFDKIKEIMNKDKENIISNSLFPKTDLFFHLIGDEDFSIPIQRVKFLMRGKNKIVVNDNLLIPIMFKTKGTTKKAGWMIEDAPLLNDYDLNLIGKNSLFFIFDEIESSSFILNKIKRNNKEVNNRKIEFSLSGKVQIVSSIIFIGIWIYFNYLIIYFVISKSP